ncbi:MAG: serine/threonine-protein kinase, partial [Terriglobales bacterium]
MSEQANRHAIDERLADPERIKLKVQEETSASALTVPETASFRAPGYRVLGLIGSGAMGRVYKAVDERTNQVYALKCIRSELVSDRTILKRLEQETQAAINLNHPNITAIHERGTAEDGSPFIVMDFVDGLTLADIIRDEGLLDPSRAVFLLIQIAGALAHAHARGVIHRDVKPSNIMISNEGGVEVVKLVDFGIAKTVTAAGAEANNTTQTAQVVGSPAYMSPEQCLGLPIDARSDIYSLGCVMYEMLCGTSPFVGMNPIQTIARQIKEKPAPLPLAKSTVQSERDLACINEKALEKLPDKRYRTMNEMHLDLMRVPANRRPKAGSAGMSCKILSLAAGVAVGLAAAFVIQVIAH